MPVSCDSGMMCSSSSWAFWIVAMRGSLNVGVFMGGKDMPMMIAMKDCLKVPIYKLNKRRKTKQCEVDGNGDEDILEKHC